MALLKFAISKNLTLCEDLLYTHGFQLDSQSVTHTHCPSSHSPDRLTPVIRFSPCEGRCVRATGLPRAKEEAVMISSYPFHCCKPGLHKWGYRADPNILHNTQGQSILNLRTHMWEIPCLETSLKNVPCPCKAMGGKGRSIFKCLKWPPLWKLRVLFQCSKESQSPKKPCWVLMLPVPMADYGNSHCSSLGDVLCRDMGYVVYSITVSAFIIPAFILTACYSTKQEHRKLPTKWGLRGKVREVIRMRHSTKQNSWAQKSLALFFPLEVLASRNWSQI